MSRNDRIALCGWSLVLCCALPYVVVGQQRAAQIQPDAHRRADEMRRDWLRKQMPQLVTDQAQLKQVLGQLDKLSADQINDLMNACLDELQAQRAQNFARLRQQNAQQRAFQQQLARALAVPIDPFFPAIGYYPPPIAYYPVVTWLPEGTSLTAQAVVSPDGRSVRTSVTPFFSSIGPVYTFNYMTGETRRLSQFDPPLRQFPAPSPEHDLNNRR